MSSGARQIQLGRKLREIRNAVGLSLDGVAARLERSRATVGHWESGYSRISAQDLEGLFRLYDTSEEMQDQLRQLRRDSHKRGWWQSYKLPDYINPFLGFEYEAAEIFHFELGVVPGLLQTEEYAKAVHEAGRLELSDDELQGWVEARIQRQKRLESGGGLTLHAVIAEEALYRIVGSCDIMARQLEYLEEVSKRASVKLRILPYKNGAHVGMHGPIMVLRSSDPSHSDVAFSDTPLGGHIIDDPRDVSELSRLYSALESQALPLASSSKQLRNIAREHISSKE
ncbi:Helix-turn-helix domain-containing protein [Actinopolyspora lacussalsi subsp. righensis]|uniref:Helix-turn-helix domain-containing protein n=2 Tax=Actinopolyspora righensis TaxID=995060 RepID=A0A1I6ZV49_9ACTN|nr:Helix-turn-helix domain-containing protein [Actinopolyspora righensis]